MKPAEIADATHHVEHARALNPSAPHGQADLRTVQIVPEIVPRAARCRVGPTSYSAVNELGFHRLTSWLIGENSDFQLRDEATCAIHVLRFLLTSTSPQRAAPHQRRRSIFLFGYFSSVVLCCACRVFGFHPGEDFRGAFIA